MHNFLTAIYNHLQSLEAFAKKYPEIEQHGYGMSDVSRLASRLPIVYIDGQHPAARHWALSTFGADIWTTRLIQGGYQTVGTVIDGVELQIWRAYPVKVVECGRATVPAHLLTGREATIELPAEVVA